VNEGRRAYHLYAVGYVRRDADGIFVEIDEPYRAGLNHLNEFSHVIVICWAEAFDEMEARKTTTVFPPHAPDKAVGVFSTRSPRRPNPILLTPCRILDVDVKSGRVRLQNLDAFDGTPVLDLKAYYPVSDRVKDAKIADWMTGWPEWIPDEGLGLQDH